MKVIKAILFFIFIFIICNIQLSCSASKKLQLLDAGGIWKRDTCGIYGERIQLAPLIIKHSKLTGINHKNIIEVFGKPDFIYESYPTSDVIQYKYSTSSLQILENGKCGDPVIRSFGVIIDKETMKVKEFKEFIH